MRLWLFKVMIIEIEKLLMLGTNIGCSVSSDRVRCAAPGAVL